MPESSDWMEEKEKKEDNKMAISRESYSSSRIYTPQKMGYIFKHIREELYHPEKELFTFSIDMES